MRQDTEYGEETSLFGHHLLATRPSLHPIIRIRSFIHLPHFFFASTVQCIYRVFFAVRACCAPLLP